MGFESLQQYLHVALTVVATVHTGRDYGVNFITSCGCSVLGVCVYVRVRSSVYPPYRC
jgi:hypothetical protein